MLPRFINDAKWVSCVITKISLSWWPQTSQLAEHLRVTLATFVKLLAFLLIKRHRMIFGS